MTEVNYPSAQIASSDFVIGAGCILFRKSAVSNQLQICLLRVKAQDGGNEKWLLPKGRKDMGESIEAAAVRETFEETGYPCELIPVRMPTRAPPPGVDVKDVVRVVDDATEPVAVTLRNLEKDGCKFTWWFTGRVKGHRTKKVEGTQTESECYVSEFFNADEAVRKVTYDRDRHAVEQALAVVRDNINVRGMDAMFP
jgi:8-oxo-dGTP pyrophosphatase MutT (NUDIX family)